MKLSVSTLGCPGLSLHEVLDLTDAAGVDGIEVRGIGGIVDSAKIPCFSPEEAEALEAHREEMCSYLNYDFHYAGTDVGGRLSSGRAAYYFGVTHPTRAPPRPYSYAYPGRCADKHRRFLPPSRRIVLLFLVGE